MDKHYEQYREELSKDRYDPIEDREVEKALIVRYKEQGDKEAFETLVCANMRFVLYLLNKDYNLPQAMSKMDIIQAGNEGLIYGIKRFNHKKHPDIKLYSYVVHWIRFHIRKVLAQWQKDKMRQAELMSDEEVETSTRVNKDEGDIYEYYQKMDAHQTENVAFDDIDEFLHQHLDPREVIIIKQYFGLTGDNPRTLEAIGQQLHIKFVRVRQLRDRALDKLHAVSDAEDFNAYF
jgi:RNA polymerase primary sigma factor